MLVWFGVRLLVMVSFGRGAVLRPWLIDVIVLVVFVVSEDPSSRWGERRVIHTSPEVVFALRGFLLSVFPAARHRVS